MRYTGLASLEECGISSDGIQWEMEFPIVLNAKWITVLRSSPLALSEESTNSNVDFFAEMNKVSTAPATANVKNVCTDSLEVLRSSHFIIEKYECYPFLNGKMLPNWQPNSLNPSLVINNTTVMGKSNLQKGTREPTMGLVAPYCTSFRLPFKPLTSIDLDVFALEKDDLTGVVKIIPVQSIITFRHR